MSKPSFLFTGTMTPIPPTITAVLGKLCQLTNSSLSARLKTGANTPGLAKPAYNRANSNLFSETIFWLTLSKVTGAFPDLLGCQS